MLCLVDGRLTAFGYHWSAYATVLVASGFADVTAAVAAGRRRAVGRTSLCVVLAAAVAWSFACALELAASSSNVSCV